MKHHSKHEEFLEDLKDVFWKHAASLELVVSENAELRVNVRGDVQGCLVIDSGTFKMNSKMINSISFTGDTKVYKKNP